MEKGTERGAVTEGGTRRWREGGFEIKITIATLTAVAAGWHAIKESVCKIIARDRGWRGSTRA